MNYLFINTVNEENPSFVIFNEKGDFLFSQKFIPKQEDLIKKIKLFLSKNKVDYKKLRAVLVVTGPGSFTGSRAGVVLANGFNFLCNIPVIGTKDDKEGAKEIINKNLSKLSKVKKTGTVEVYYNREPNITVKK